MDLTNDEVAVSPTMQDLALTPQALAGLLKISVPAGAVTVKGIATEVRPWPNDGKVLRIYGRLALGGASVRFELHPHVKIKDDMPVVLHGTLRVKQSDAYRATHELSLVGDVAGGWFPHEPVIDTPSTPLVRTRPRMPLEVAVRTHGLASMGFMVTQTGWQDLRQAAFSVPAVANCRSVLTNFMQPERFLADFRALCEDPSIQIVTVVRGGGVGLEVIGDSRAVAEALLSCGRPFYTALGHDADVMLLDKHADQLFSTPSMMGQALVDVTNKLKFDAVREERVVNLEASNRRLVGEIDKLKAQIAASVPDRKAQPDALDTAVPPTRLEINSQAGSISWLGAWLALAVAVVVLFLTWWLR